METKKKMQFLDLYRMVMADGTADPKEMTTLYRIGLENYGLTQEEMSEVISQGVVSTSIPELQTERIKLLYQMSIIAWADGVIEESEHNLLQKYALRFGVKEDKTKELIDFLLAKVQENVGEDEIIKYFE